jgi:hypothetical protein
MPTRTSTQSGNFNSTATWGGAAVPVDGDDFIVNYGHIVTINDDRRVTNGFNDSYVRGKLYITGSGKLRMNGILYIDNTANNLSYFSDTGFGPSIGVNITIGNADLFATSAHMLAPNTPIQFTTNGTLPSNILANTTYYVIASNLVQTFTENSTANYRFRIATAINGTAITPAGSSSGSHTFRSVGSGGGFFRMDPGTILEIAGSNADQHRLHIQPHAFVTCEIEGTNPNPQTTLSSATTNNSASISVVDASQFAINDWISVYKNERANKAFMYYKNDEGFWIHDISSNTIYIRHFVSPKTTILSVQNNVAIVDDASVFRKGYNLIFGVGANRNILTITDINYSTNAITFNSNIAGSVVGQIMYQTGIEKYHESGDNVLRISAVLTSSASAGANTIVVNNTNGFSVGDRIVIEQNDPLYTATWNRVMDHTITSIDSINKTITIGSSYTEPARTTLLDARVAGALVVNLNRSTKVRAPEGTLYNAAQHGFIFAQYFTTNAYQRRIKIINSEINIGPNTNSAEYGCLGMRGHQSYDLVSYGAYTSEVSGNSIYCVNHTSYSNTGYLWEQHQINYRNNITYNAGTWGMASNANNRGWFNNIALRTSTGFYLEGLYEPYTRIEYNYCSRSGTCWSINQWHENNAVFRHNYGLFGIGRTLNLIYQNGFSLLDKCYFDYTYHPPYSDRSTFIIFLNCYLGNNWDVTGPTSNILYQEGVNHTSYPAGNPDRGSYFNNLRLSLCHNFRYNDSLLLNHSAARTYDKTLKAWRVYVDIDDIGLKGFLNTVLVPANSQVLIRAKVKMVPGNTNYPIIYAARVIDSSRQYENASNIIYYNGREYNSNYATLGFNSAQVTGATGFVNTSVAFTSNSIADFEERTLTLPALPFDYFVNIGIVCQDILNNGKFGWWEKDLEIYLDGQQFNPESILSSFLVTKIPVTRRISYNDTKIRLAGRLSGD